jgi:hypothetical protein
MAIVSGYLRHQCAISLPFLAHLLEMGNGQCCSWLALEAYMLVVGLPGLSVGQEEDEAVLPRHSTPLDGARW